MKSTGRNPRAAALAGLIACLVALLVAAPRTARATDDTATKIPRSLELRAQTDGSVRVLVHLALSASSPGGPNNRGAWARWQRAIATGQGRVVRDIGSHRGRIMRKFHRVPFLAMEVDSDALAALKGSSGVVDVREDSAVPLTLMDSAPLIGADAAWAIGRDGNGWSVAVLDSGVDETHPFFGGRVVAEACFSAGGNCPNGSTTQIGLGAAAPCTYSPECEHGTHVTGIASGMGAALSGIARGADIIAVQVTSDVGGAPVSFTSDQIAALEWVYDLAATRQIASVNMSLGAGHYTSQAACDAGSAAVKAAIDNLRSANVATIVSAGNDGYVDGLASPACISTAVGVGCTSKSDDVCQFSDSAPFLSLWAPGLNIFSSVPGGDFDFLSGTSMSAPHVAGAWAVLRQALPAATVDTVLQALRTSGLPITDPRNGVTVPRVNVRHAITELVCGNGVVDPGEACDDDNRMSGDGCDANCTITACGNDVVTTGEQCDDGNADPGDGCKPDCTLNVCGDGVVWRGVEACDDGNLVNGDGCSSTCQIEEAGGSQIAGQWVSHGPEGGTSVAIVIDPVNPNIVYAGTGMGSDYGGGVFKSTDGGTTWMGASTGLTAFRINALAINPVNRSVLYAGTESGRVFKTADAATTWSDVTPIGLFTNSIYGMAIDPSAPDTVYLGSSGQGVFKTIDGGATWTFAGSGITNAGTVDLAIDPSHASTLYAAVYTGGLFKTTNGGTSWTSISGGIPTLGIDFIRIDPIAPTTLYAATQGAGIFKSTNAGVSWTAVNSGLTESSITAITLAPSAPNTLYAGTFSSGVFKTTNGGASWSSVKVGLPDKTTITGLMAHPTNAATVYAAPFVSGLFLTTNGGNNWISTSTGFTAAAVRSVVLDPTTPTTIYASVFESGHQGGQVVAGLYRSIDAGASWTIVSGGLPGLVVQTLAIDPNNTQILYAGLGGAGVFKTVNHGTSWAAANGGLANLYANAIAVDPSSPSTVYCGTDGGVFVSTSGGTSWTAASNGLPAGTPVHSLALDPVTPSIVYAGMQNGGVYKSIDGGMSWFIAGSGLETLRAVEALAIDPTMPATVYAGNVGGGVSKSIDGGVTWNPANTGVVGDSFDVRAIAIDPSNPNRVYRGSSAGGVYMSTDQGSTWTQLNLGLTALDVRALAVDPDIASKIYAGTYGGGVFRREAFCGDGVKEGAEQCDDGNTQDGDCCSSTCQAEANGIACADDGKVCTADVCEAGICVHPPGNAGVFCRPSAGACDLGERCTGTSSGCPADAFQSGGVVCRPADGVCDRAETCTGTGPDCPTDAFLPNGTPCAGGTCNGADVCVAATTTTTTAASTSTSTTAPPTTTSTSSTTSSSLSTSSTSSTSTPPTTTSTTIPLPCPPVPASGCQPASSQRAVLKLGKGTTPDKNKIGWKWVSSGTVVPGDFGDPTAGTGYALCVYGPGGRVMAAMAPGGGTCSGKPCWALVRTGAKYTNKALTPDGLLKISLKAGGSGQGKIGVKGKGANLLVPAFPLGMPVHVQLRREDTGSCWDAVFSTALVNTEAAFKGKSD
jgi:cysteine-rich repeat protein